MHRELDRVKQSYFDKQHGFTRTYAEKLSILTNMLILVWILGLTTFYMSLALVYGRFTYYFCWPTLILGLITSVYQSHIVTVIREIQLFNQETQTVNFKVFKL